MSEIVFKNWGPIRSLRIPVPPEGGVVVLQGRNGRGKSTALAAVDAVVRNQKPVATVHDGESRGELTLAGVTVRLAKRASVSGDLGVEEITDDVRPADIVNPNIIDPERREAKRIRGLVRLIGAVATPDMFQLAEGHEIPFDPGQSDAVDMANTARTRLQAIARDHERERDRALVQAEALRQLGVDPPDDAMPVSAAEQQLLDCASAAGRVREQRRAWVDSVNAGSLDDLATARDVAASECEILRRDAVSHASRVSELTSSMADLRLKLAEAQAAEAAATKLLAAADVRRRQAEAALQKCQQLAGVKEVTDADVKEVEDEYLRAKGDLDLARAADQAAGRRETYIAAKAEAQAHDKMAERMRDLAVSGVEDVLSELLTKTDDGLSVRNGLVCVRTDRSDHEPFEDLSQAERWMAVMNLVVKRLGRGAIIAVPQEVYDGMDSTTRQQLSLAATTTGVVILTAEQTDSDELEVTQTSADIWS